MFPRGKIVALDGLRGLAILPVLALHASYGRVPGGFLGVDLFFVLSGFLITSLLFREYADTGTIRLTHFFARRALRILPPIVVGILLAWLLTGFDPLKQARPIVLFYANYVDPRNLGSMAHTWSLAVEEQFYFVWPLLFLVCMLYGGKKAAIVAAASVFVLSSAGRAIAVSQGADFDWLYRSSLTRADSLAAGCLAALISVEGNERHPSADAITIAFLAVYLALIFVAQQLNGFMTAWGYTLFACAAAIAVRSCVYFNSKFVTRVVSQGWLLHVGKLSYGMYLYHFPIFLALDGLRVRHSVVNFLLLSALKVAATLLVAEVSFRLLESPLLKLKRRFVAGSQEDSPPAKAAGFAIARKEHEYPAAGGASVSTHSEQTTASSGARPTLVILICTMDRPHELHRCLSSIAAGEAQPDEIVVSDDSPNGRETAAVCSAFHIVRYAPGPRRGLCANRNAVIKHARADFVSLLDDDVVVSPDFISVARATIAGLPARTLVTGTVLDGGHVVVPGNPSFLGFFGRASGGNFKNINLVCNLFPRTAFDEGSFDEAISYGYEDMDLCSRLLSRGYVIRHVPALLTTHVPTPRTIAMDRERFVVSGRARFYTSVKRYLLYERSPTKLVAFVMVAPLHRVMHAIKARKWFDLPHALPDMWFAVSASFQAWARDGRRESSVLSTDIRSSGRGR